MFHLNKWLSQAQLDAALPLPPQLPSNLVEHIYYSDLRYVHDGDSIRLQGGDQVRMRYINSLELARYSYPAQPLAQAARDYVMSHLNELRVYLQFGLQQQDHYGRVAGQGIQCVRALGSSSSGFTGVGLCREYSTGYCTSLFVATGTRCQSCKHWLMGVFQIIFQ